LKEIGPWHEKIHGKKRMMNAEYGEAKYGEGREEISDENLILKEMK